MRHDIRDASFEQFVHFLFARETPVSDDSKVEPWYWHVRVKYDPDRVASYYIRLFTSPRGVLSSFAAHQLEQGFLAIQASTLDCCITNIIWHRRISLNIREDCVRAMYHLFEQCFAEHPLDQASHMWWDSMAYAWHCGNRARVRGGEDESMQDVMFATLARILALPAESCQVAALHGLGHLHHPDTDRLVQHYLAEHSSIAPDLRAYALAAAQFMVL